MNTLGLEKAPGDTRVVVAMSGGVDSSATAALLTEQGYDVIGVTLWLYEDGMCCDAGDARRVADMLGFSHQVVDMDQAFATEVVDYFADSYLKGETPIPCARCNRLVKFSGLLTFADKIGADLVATGHYARWVEGPELHRGEDLGRDQSYFLFALTRDQLARVRFPLGRMSKDETRALARRFDLPVASKGDSQDICFLPEGRYADLLEKLRPGAIVPGDIIDLDGRVLGQHQGIVNFTVGQRRGLDIGGAAERLYVVRLDPATAHVVVGPLEALLKKEMKVARVNWLADVPTDTGLRADVKVRSAQNPVPATIFDGGARVVFDQPVAGVAPGQASVFYDADRVLGGGWIARDDA
jgi:tRNA-uridine 2-sulfurtransferase